MKSGEICSNIVLTEGNEGGLFVGCYGCLGESHPFVQLGVAWDVRYLPCCQNGWESDEDPPCELGDDDEQRRVTILMLAAQRAKMERGFRRDVDGVDFNTALLGYDFYERA